MVYIPTRELTPPGRVVVVAKLVHIKIDFKAEVHDWLIVYAM